MFGGLLSVIQLVVSDSSCLIDLRKCGLLTTTLLLPFQFVVALPLVSAELHGFTDADWNDLRTRGLDVIDLDATQVRRAFELKAAHAGLSAYDCFSLALAETNAKSILLTGDQQLRHRATTLGVDVHGILWVADQIEQTGKMPSSSLLDALFRLDADPLVFLPKEELQKRIERLKRSIHGQG
jgi:predicted nucleic acid-binding protein